MGGGVLDLVAKGGQDVFFICNPEISFFKKVYKRHTNFSTDKQKFLIDTDFGRTVMFTIPKNGDLLKSFFLQIELPTLSLTQKIGYINYIGYSIIDYVELYIGGQPIDKITGEFMYIQNEIIFTETQKKAYNKMVGGNSDVVNFDIDNRNLPGTYIIPLNFWFTQDIGLALPLVALQYHDVELKIKLRSLKDIYIASPNTIQVNNELKIKSVNLNCEYVYLDSKERKKFAQESHEYLIRQTQYNLANFIGANTLSKKIPLDFNHPVLELIFVVQRIDRTNSTNGGNDYFNYSMKNNMMSDTVDAAKILLNNTDRTNLMIGKELRYLNYINTHTSIPDNIIYLFPFALEPESFQPTGSCNFSRFDNKELFIEFKPDITDSEVKIFAVNHNILRISSGLGGLAYIN